MKFNIFLVQLFDQLRDRYFAFRTTEMGLVFGFDLFLIRLGMASDFSSIELPIW